MSILPKGPLVILILALAACEAAACPGCTYERMLLNDFFQKAFLVNVGAALLFTAYRLDVVRLLGVFVPYAILCLWAGLRLMFASFRWGASNPLVITLECIVGFNLVGVGLLFWMGRNRFFRREKDRGLALWQPVAYAAAAVIGTFILRMR